MRLGVHARAAHLEAERKRRARLRSVRPSLAIRSNARKPHYHALRLIEASKSSHRRSKAVHRDAWNSRTGAQPEKQAVRRPVDRSRTLRRGGGSTASTAAAKLRAQEKSRALASGVQPARILAQKKSKYSFEDSLRGGTSCLITAGTRALHSDASQDENRRTNIGNTGAKARSSKYARQAGPYGMDSRRRKVKKRSWTRRGMKLKRPGATTAARRVRKVRNSRTAIGTDPRDGIDSAGKEKLRASSAPASDNKGVPAKEWRARPSSQGSNVKGLLAGNQNRLPFRQHHLNADQEDKDEVYTRDLSTNNRISSAEEGLFGPMQSGGISASIEDDSGEDAFSLGTIDPGLLSEKRTLEDDEDFDKTPGGIWGDGVGLDLSTILECSESQSFATFLSPATQKLMAPHLYSSGDGCQDCGVPEKGCHADVEHNASQNSAAPPKVIPSEGQAPQSKHATIKLRAAIIAVRAVVAFRSTLHRAKGRFRRTCPRPPQHEVDDGSLTSRDGASVHSLADDMPSFAPLTKPDLDGSLVLFDGMNSCLEEENAVNDDCEGVEDSDYSASEFYEDSFGDSSGLTMTPRADNEEPDGECLQSPADIQSQPSTAVASSVMEDSLSYCSEDDSSVLTQSVADGSEIASITESRDNIVHDSSDTEYDDSYAIDDWEEEEKDDDDVLVKKLAHLLSGTDLQQEIRDKLRRDLER
eukprot:g5111.t1